MHRPLGLPTRRHDRAFDRPPPRLLSPRETPSALPHNDVRSLLSRASVHHPAPMNTITAGTAAAQEWHSSLQSKMAALQATGRARGGCR